MFKICLILESKKVAFELVDIAYSEEMREHMLKNGKALDDSPKVMPPQLFDGENNFLAVSGTKLKLLSREKHQVF